MYQRHVWSLCSWNFVWKCFFLSFLSYLTSFQSKIDTVAQSIPLGRIFSLMLISREKWDLWNSHPSWCPPIFPSLLLHLSLTPLHFAPARKTFPLRKKWKATALGTAKVSKVSIGWKAQGTRKVASECPLFPPCVFVFCSFLFWIYKFFSYSHFLSVRIIFKITNIIILNSMWHKFFTI